MKKKKRVRKIKFKNVLILLIIIVLISFLVWGYLSLKVKNIYVIGNNILKEQDIIELANLKDYPKLYKVSKSKITRMLLTNPFIEKVIVDKTILGKITIKITEYQVLYKNQINDTITLSSKESIMYDNDILGIPFLTNQVDETIYDKFIQKMMIIDKNILSKISEISYEPNELDNERFLLYMNDQIYVYLTLSKWDMINTYMEIIPTLDGKKGILYLDSGNHFQIK